MLEFMSLSTYCLTVLPICRRPVQITDHLPLSLPLQFGVRVHFRRYSYCVPQIENQHQNGLIVFLVELRRYLETLDAL